MDIISELKAKGIEVNVDPRRRVRKDLSATPVEFEISTEPRLATLVGGISPNVLAVIDLAGRVFLMSPGIGGKVVVHHGSTIDGTPAQALTINTLKALISPSEQVAPKKSKKAPKASEIASEPAETGSDVDVVDVVVEPAPVVEEIVEEVTE
jgi:hypothetical protein